ncbi:DUF485 domain-containing protein [Actinomadura sp. KC06]|uniref:DUF485 domain-containing protein n=1 Tax=Actinomadura sp. KC06 TaxID=2530369 RepID=UPI0014055225|nr:DUF485 domain-containing protein [Actinomadura sp. KC06]
MPHTPEPPPGGPDHTEHDAMIQRHKRVVLGAAAITIVVFMAFPILASFTGALDGVADGIGAGYAAGLAVILLPLAGAVAYRRWTSRIEDGGRR